MAKGPASTSSSSFWNQSLVSQMLGHCCSVLSKIILCAL